MGDPAWAGGDEGPGAALLIGGWAEVVDDQRAVDEQALGSVGADVEGVGARGGEEDLAAPPHAGAVDVEAGSDARSGVELDGTVDAGDGGRAAERGVVPALEGQAARVDGAEDVVGSVDVDEPGIGADGVGVKAQFEGPVGEGGEGELPVAQ